MNNTNIINNLYEMKESTIDLVYEVMQRKYNIHNLDELSVEDFELIKFLIDMIKDRFDIYERALLNINEIKSQVDNNSSKLDELLKRK